MLLHSPKLAWRVEPPVVVPELPSRCCWRNCAAWCFLSLPGAPQAPSQITAAQTHLSLQTVHAYCPFFRDVCTNSPNVQPLRRTLTDLDQNVLGVFGEPTRIDGVVCSYGLKQLFLVAAVERRLTDEHLVQQHAERPPVHWAVVLLPQQDLNPHKHTVEAFSPQTFWSSFIFDRCVCVGHLRSDVVWCPAESGCPWLVLHVLLTHAKVCYLYMTIRVQQYIIQLQIPAEENMWTTCHWASGTEFHISLLLRLYL